MLFWGDLAFRPVGCLLLRIGRGYLLAGIVRDFIDIRIWMIGVAHGRSPGHVGQSLLSAMRVHLWSNTGKPVFRCDQGASHRIARILGFPDQLSEGPQDKHLVGEQQQYRAWPASRECSPMRQESRNFASAVGLHRMQEHTSR
ncbi:hypothetical protein A6E23_19775 [Pseudomonas putida]|nr:hypothetical protein A6E23_19775 [Pseudomonas putida]OCT26699.1 hypothetical protein A6E24_09425 [Pseudomonas putida]